ncbi:hypothetical protein PAPYR_9343 [Paratrimastix pyriformis]|uniref:Uncharacterized protein n=1 Tax=Paratrimastix pyriformis TaxID=342808 RepID=A0ABQ8UE91_9EUKA|nr:hypothetical protein PAPYR_9343 [Paratrimastix pyriformis]
MGNSKTAFCRGPVGPGNPGGCGWESGWAERSAGAGSLGRTPMAPGVPLGVPLVMTRREGAEPGAGWHQGRVWGSEGPQDTVTRSPIGRALGRPHDRPSRGTPSPVRGTWTREEPAREAKTGQPGRLHPRAGGLPPGPIAAGWPAGAKGHPQPGGPTWWHPGTRSRARF